MTTNNTNSNFIQNQLNQIDNNINNKDNSILSDHNNSITIDKLSLDDIFSELMNKCIKLNKSQKFFIPQNKNCFSVDCYKGKNDEIIEIDNIDNPDSDIIIFKGI